jgi:PIN domain nuclease of toxin-antitoxin system
VKHGTDTRVVLDASALLAYLGREPGGERVGAAIRSGASISTVNLAEVYTKLASRGFPIEPVRTRLTALGMTVTVFSENDAADSAELHAHTRHAGLSLGDRACLALARRLKVPAVTADRAWAGLRLDVEVQLLR